MIEVVRWLAVIEVLGLAFLPLTVWLFRSLPDRGYIFAKILGTVMVTYFTWLVGSFTSLAGGTVVPWMIVVIFGAAGWWLLRHQTLDALRSLRTIVAVEEGLFIGAFVLWCVMRAQVFGPGIGHTEQYMDMSLLGASIRSASYPPFDPWMSGHGINYYYMGYLLFAILIKLSGAAPAVGYNLALSHLFAITVAGSYGLAYALTRRMSWSMLGPVLVAVIGNWHAILAQLPAGHQPSEYYWFWSSTRVISGNNNITEFPFFSFMLGDLHPHVMAIPIALLVLALGAALLFTPETIRFRSPQHLVPLACAAIAAGMLFTVNSWDYPTYLAVIAACIVVRGYLSDDSARWWLRPALTVGGLVVASIILYAPFFAHYSSPTHGIGLVTTPSPLGDFLQVFGLLLLLAVLCVGSLWLLLQPADNAAELETPLGSQRGAASEAGTVRTALASQLPLYAMLLAAAIIGARFQMWVLLLVLGIGGWSLLSLHRVLNTEAPNLCDALALLLVTAGCAAIAIPEMLYVKDTFDNSSMYRMNSVFKFYYQAWILLGIAGAYGIYRSRQILNDYFSPRYAWAAITVVAVAVAGGAYYTVNAPQSANQGGAEHSLDGSAVLQSSAPGDYAAVQWLGQHSRGNPVELEATSGEYDATSARISTFTGLPTVLGWAGHEGQWRPGDPEIQKRVIDIKTMYTSSDPVTVSRLLRGYDVRYVVVGRTERTVYPGENFDRLRAVMHPVFSRDGTTIYGW